MTRSFDLGDNGHTSGYTAVLHIVKVPSCVRLIGMIVQSCNYWIVGIDSESRVKIQLSLTIVYIDVVIEVIREMEMECILFPER